MERKTINVGMAVMALVLSLGLSGCGRSKQSASLALEEARLNISAARSSGAQTYAAQTLKSAADALKEGEKAFGTLHFDIARAEAEKAVRFAVAAKDEAEKKVAEKKAAKKASATARKKTASSGKKK